MKLNKDIRSYALLVRNFIEQKIIRFKDQTYKYYSCPKCRQTIRVPKGKGKICITCPKCKAEFKKTT